MSDQSDSQNKSEEQVHMSEGTSPSSSYDDGSRSTRNILAAEKNKAPVPEAAIEEEEDESHVLRKLKPKIPDHNDAHPVTEDMKLKKDARLR